ncbi:uncharacterized protein [Physcomitrium patens]|uniref:uncharacterized protein n=1 Tax=Physcomitrium patens TaxID=3218 RepID=UPI003CCC95D7
MGIYADELLVAAPSCFEFSASWNSTSFHGRTGLGFVSRSGELQCWSLCGSPKGTTRLSHTEKKKRKRHLRLELAKHTTSKIEAFISVHEQAAQHELGFKTGPRQSSSKSDYYLINLAKRCFGLEGFPVMFGNAACEVLHLCWKDGAQQHLEQSTGPGCVFNTFSCTID